MHHTEFSEIGKTQSVQNYMQHWDSWIVIIIIALKFKLSKCVVFGYGIIVVRRTIVLEKLRCK